MASVNVVIVAGNLTRDPEMKFLPSGMAVAQIGLAVNRKFKDSKSNEMREEVTFVDITVFGKQAEAVGAHLQKGSQALVEGRLQMDQWEDKQSGQKRSKLKVVADRVQFLGGKGQTPKPRAAGDTPELDAEGDVPAENIPF